MAAIQEQEASRQEDAFAQLIAPMQPATFWADYWQQQPVVFSMEKCENSGSTSSWKRPLKKHTWEDCCTLLTHAWGAAPVRVPAGCELLVFDKRELTHQFDAQGPCAALLKGASCVVNHAEYIWAPFGNLCYSLRERLVHVYCNTYVTPAKTQAVPAHADDRDVFVLQLCGRKSWRVWKDAPIMFPYSHEQVGKAGLDIPDSILESKPCIECVLEAGDVLYMPRGFVHEAFCEEDYSSWHATLAVATHDWSWSKVVTGATSAILDGATGARWKEAVPLSLGCPGGTDRSIDGKSIDETLEEVLATLKESLKAEALSSHFHNRIASHNRMQETARREYGSAMASFRENTGNGQTSDAWPFLRPLEVHSRSQLRAPSKEERQEALDALHYSVMISKGKGKGKGLPRLDGVVVRDEILGAVKEVMSELRRPEVTSCVLEDLCQSAARNTDCPCFDSLAALCLARAGLTAGMIYHAAADLPARAAEPL